MKRAKSTHFCILLDTLTPRRRSGRLGEPEAKSFEFFDLPRRRNPRLGEPLRLGVALLRLDVPKSHVLVPLFRKF